MRLILVPTLLVMGLLLAGAKLAYTPERGPSTVTVEADKIEVGEAGVIPLWLNVRAHNEGPGDIQVLEKCVSGLRFRVTHETGREIHAFGNEGCGKPLLPQYLSKGRSVNAEVPFVGYDRYGAEIPPGNYTFQATFHWRELEHDSPQQKSVEVAFEWPVKGGIVG